MKYYACYMEDDLVSSMKGKHGAEYVPDPRQLANVNEPTTSQPVMLFQHANKENLEHILLSSPCKVCVEVTPTMPSFPAMQRALSEHALTLSLITKTAYDIDVTELVMQYLRQNRVVKTPVSYNVYTAVHEALMNAILHGNLEVSGNIQTKENLSVFAPQFDKQINNPALHQKRVMMEVDWDDDHLTVTIRDEGKLPPEGEIDSRGFSGAICGRGLMVIKHCTESYELVDGRITMIFKR